MKTIAQTSRHLPTLALACLAAWPVASLAQAPAGSAYFTDPQESYVQDATSEAIGSVNNIMCYLSSMSPGALVNEPLYAALVDSKRCETGVQDAAATPSYVRALVSSTRVSNADPMNYRVWVEQRDGDREQDIYVRGATTEGPSAGRPNGLFRIDYAMPGAPGSAPTMQGYLAAEAGGMSFVEQSDRGQGVEFIRLRLRSAADDSGDGVVSFPDGSGGSRTLAFAYDATHFRRVDGAADLCFSRSLEAASKSTWRYGLYDAVTGERIERNGGFSFHADLAGRRTYGYIGYHGLGIDQANLARMTNGTVLHRQAAEGEPTEQYALVRTGGKLVRHQRIEQPLDSVAGIAIQAWLSPSIPNLDIALQGQSAQLRWVPGLAAFNADGIQVCDQNGCRLDPLVSPVSITAADLLSAGIGGLQGWSEQLGGQVYVPETALNDPSLPIVRRAEQIVPPGSVNLPTLHCVADCLTAAGMQQTAASLAADPFGATSRRYDDVAAVDVLTYQVGADGVLTHAATPVVFGGTAESLAGSAWQSGFRTGRLVADLAALECSPGSGTYCANNAEALAEFYTWETGPNSWNEYAGARDARGDLVVFTPPLRVTWSVPDAPGYGDLRARDVVLQYPGFGDLHGIPGACVNPGTNAVVDCQTQGARWVPQFSIPMDEGTGAVTEEGGSRRFLVKWLNREVRLASVAGNACAGLTVGDVSELPSASGLLDPSDPTAPEYIGAKPVHDAAPRIEDGVVIR